MLLLIHQRLVALIRAHQLLHIISFLLFLIIHILRINFSHVDFIFTRVSVLAAVEEARIANIHHINLFLLINNPWMLLIVTINYTCCKIVFVVITGNHLYSKWVVVSLTISHILVDDFGMVAAITLIMKRCCFIWLTAVSVEAAVRAAPHGAVQRIPHHSSTKSYCLVVIEAFLCILPVGVL